MSLFKKLNKVPGLKSSLAVMSRVLLIIGIGSLILWNKYSEVVAVGTLESKLIQAKEKQEKEYLNWMYKNSNESKKGLQEIYSKVESDKLRDVLLSMMEVESSFNPKAASNMSAICLMQIRYPVWESELKKQGIITEYRDLWDSSTCIDAGKYIFLHYLKKSNGDMRLALTKYVGSELGTKDSEVYTGRILANIGELMLLTYE